MIHLFARLSDSLKNVHFLRSCIFGSLLIPTELMGHDKIVNKWWEKMVSNHRRRRQRIYSPPPLATRAFSHLIFDKKMELMNGLEPLTC